MHTEGYWAVIFLMWSFTGEIYAQWRILSCYCPQVVSQRWEYVLWRILTIYLDVMVLRWPLKGEKLAHWRILRCHCPQVVFQRWELWTLKDIEMLLSSSGPSAWYWDFIALRWSLTCENYAHWRILRCYCPQVVQRQWRCHFFNFFNLFIYAYVTICTAAHIQNVVVYRMV